MPSKSVPDNENAARSSEYAKEVKVEDFLASLNRTLVQFDRQQYPQEKSQYPLILVSGLPRSGTTLLMQCLVNYLDLGYVSNVASKFWEAPLTGFRLSSILGQNNGQSDFKSDFGKSSTLSGPHEFAYFWKKWLHISSDQAYDPASTSSKIDYQGLSQTLHALLVEANAPFAFKGMHPVRHLEQLQPHFSKIVVIHIARPFIDIAHSLKKARLKYYGDPNHWWSMTTPDYNQLIDQPYHVQIPHQMRSLLDSFEANYATLPEENLIRIEFQDLVNQPRMTLQSIASRLEKISGMGLKRPMNQIPDAFNVPKAAQPDPLIVEQVAKLLP